MYGGAPFGGVPFGAINQSSSEPSIPAPSGGGSMMLMGIRSILLVLALPFVS
jgi:hypothetical protein